VSAVSDAIAYCKAQLGTPYLWGGEGNGGFDCSGLMQMAYKSAGVEIPRVAQAQYDATPKVTGKRLPGDLVFFGTSTTGVLHVGMYLGAGMMIDAPHTGAFVRIEKVFTQSGDEHYLGATRPGAGGQGVTPITTSGVTSATDQGGTENAGLLSSATSGIAKWAIGGIIVLGGVGLVATGIFQGVKTP
jgi:hypothetical protein